ncbi:MAG: transposase [Thermodesulfobacteriota bacterium]
MKQTSSLSFGHRRSIRLTGYNYAQSGAYFVTLCTHKRRCLFGRIVEEQIVLNHLGLIVQEEWVRSADMRKEIDLDVYVVMPNHVHGIVFIDSYRVAEEMNDSSQEKESHVSQQKGPTKKSLSSMVAGFKSSVTKRQRVLAGKTKESVWQRNYYEHIIRNDDDLQMVREYIVTNPISWERDKLHPVFGS